MTAPHIETVLGLMVAQKGKRYVWAAEASPLDSNPYAFDCSELIEWACARAGVSPRVPDGSSAQWAHVRAHGRVLPVAVACRTRGAVLWHPGHIAMSLGDLTTIEARGRAYGVGTFSSPYRFTGAGLFPGIDYSARGVARGGMPGGRPMILGRGHVTGSAAHPSEAVKFFEAMLRIATRDRCPRPSAVDGVWGVPMTECTRAFQRAHGLAADGLAGPLTMKAVGDAVHRIVG